MNVSQQIKLLEPQITKLDELEKVQDYESYDAWHMQTELLLKKILSDSASEVQEFHRLDGKSNVVVSNRNPSAQAINAQRKTEAYFRDVKKSRSLLKGLFDFLKSTESGEESTVPLSAGTLGSLHEKIQEKCTGLYLGGHYPEAVEKSFKVVRDRLRFLTDHETGSKAFGEGGLYINGASAQNVDKDFQDAVKFLTMAIDQFRNEKSHTSDGKIEDPIRAYEYLTLSSLAMHLLDDSKVKEKNKQSKKQKSEKTQKPATTGEKTLTLDSLQILALKLFAAMPEFKELMISRYIGGSNIVPGDVVNAPSLLKDLEAVNVAEFEASLDELASWGLVVHEYSSRGTPKYRLAKPGYVAIRENPEFTVSAEVGE
ncbi:MAG: hypothetical protein JWO54_930 [Candidatus Saccharibacteria bacterium]|nr:hypothetical protein [Candidatus Saccharibacteria bacterium]